MASNKHDLQDTLLRNFGNISQLSLNKILKTDDTDGEMETIQTSPYLSTEELPVYISDSTDSATSFRILSLNIHAKFDGLQLLLNAIVNKDSNFDAICLQETWLSDESDTSLLQLEGFTCICKGKSVSAHGGLIIYLDNKYEFSVIKESHESDIWESLLLKISGSNLKNDIILGNIYKPPKNNNNNLNINTFITELEPLLHKLNTYSAETILVGDFNINLLKIHEREIFAVFLETMLQNSFFPKITLPTRIGSHSCSLIDNIFCKMSHNSCNTSSGILVSDLSDHFPYFLSINNICTTPVACSPKFVKIRLNNSTRYSSFLNDLLRNDPYVKLDSTPYADPNQNYEILNQHLSHLKNKHLPIKIVKYHKHRHKKSKWITAGLIKSIKYRDKLYQHLKTTSSDSPNYNTRKINLSTYNGILKKSIREAKTQYYHTQFEKYKHDIKQTWATISNIISRSKRDKSKINELLIDGRKITDEKLMAEKFNNFFVNIGPKLVDENKNKNSDVSYHSFLNNRVFCSFHFTLITESDISKTIKSLQNKTSSGHDGISVKLLKLLAPGLSKSLTLIINQSLLTGIFPNKLKIAKVIPLYKKGDHNIIGNYRPISLLPSISKVFEKIVYNQLYSYFSENDLFYDGQYGFRNNHSTELASIDFIDRILQYLDNKQKPIAIYMDLSKAFDTLNHNILLNKLQFYGVHNTELQFFKSYLTSRMQYVEINDYQSKSMAISTGVPQGSILGPLLFLIFMNDIPSSSQAFNFLLYADDTTLLSTVDCNLGLNASENIINRELSKIYTWLICNKLTLNISKTKFMIFDRRNRIPPTGIPKLCIDKNQIERVNNFNFLGLHIDHNLSWKTHTNILSTKISKYCGIFNKLKRYLPPNILRTLYCSLVCSLLNYGILVWGFVSNRLEKLQKKIIRIISNSKFNAHTEPLFKRLNLLKVKDLFKLNVLKFYFKHQNSTLPAYFMSFTFVSGNQTHQYNTRHSQTLRTAITRTSFAKKCLRHELPSLLNSMPPEILNKVTTHSYLGFSNYVKKFLINAYSNHCQLIDCYICNNQT